MTEPKKKKRYWPLFGAWALYASLIVAVVVLASNGGQMRDDLTTSHKRINQFASEIVAERGWTAAMTSPGVRVSNFTLTESADPALRGRATVDPISRRAVLVFDHVDPPLGNMYFVWALHGNTPVLLQYLTADQNGRAVIKVGDVGDPATLTAFVVSHEPQNASGKEPTGPIVMIGSMAP